MRGQASGHSREVTTGLLCSSARTALPFRPADENPRSDSLNVVEMLGGNAVEGRGLDKSVLTRLNLGEWLKGLTISGKADKTLSQPNIRKSSEGKNGV